MKRKMIHKIVSFVLVLALMVTSFVTPDMTVLAKKAAKKATLGNKKITLTVGKKATIKIKYKNKKAKYSFKTSSKKIATVSSKGVVKAIKAGTAKITVKEKYKKKTRTLGKVTIKVNPKKKKPSQTSKPGNSNQDKPGTGNEDKPGTGNENKPGTGDEDKPGTGDEDKPGTGDEDKPGTGDEDKPGTGEEEKPGTGEEEPTEPSTVYLNRFEDGDPNGINARGAAALEISNSENHSEGGKNCLVVTSRTDTWHGATMNLKPLVKVGETYIFTTWVKMPEGSETQTINMTLEYKTPEGISQWKGIGSAAAGSEWVEITGSYTIPEYSDILNVVFEIPGSKTADFLMDDVEIYGVPLNNVSFTMTDEVYNDMISSSLLSTGNNARMKKVIEKAKKGEDVTLAFIGGSITEGALATPNSNCYVETCARLFAEKYGKDGGKNVHFVNAGMSGTPSSLGIVRYTRDVIGQMEYGGFGSVPDVLFIEFAVNDAGEVTQGGGYEGLIRTALSQCSAVFLVFSVFQGDGITPNRVCESSYIPYGKHYNLPMVSMGDAVKAYFTQDGFQSWYFGDSLHPNNKGHLLMAKCIMNVIDKMNEKATDTDNVTDVASFKAYKTDAYRDIKMIDAATDASKVEEISSIEAGGFTEKDPSTCNFQYLYKGQKSAQWFPDNWMHGKTGGSESFKITLNCKSLMVLYKASNSSDYGSADVYLDGQKVKTLSCYETSGWNNAKMDVLFLNDHSAEHTLELKMTDPNKCFTLIGLGYRCD